MIKTRWENSVWRIVSSLLFVVAMGDVDLLAGKAPRVVFMIGELEYQTSRTLTRFAREELVSEGVDCQFALVNDSDPNDFPGLNNLSDADLLVVSVRRRTPPKEQMKWIREFIDRGGAVMGIRTSSHAFDREPPSEEHERWEHFDNEVFGGDYQGHYGNKPPYDPRSHIWMTPEGREHPILADLEVDAFRSTAHLYKNRQMAREAKVLLAGSVVGSEIREPVAWTYQRLGTGRRFYTSLGDPEDFDLRPFRRMLKSAFYWCLGQDTAPDLKVSGAPRVLSMSLQERDPESGRPLTTLEHVPTHRVGVVAVDMWNWHWCKTSTQRVGALVPRMNRALQQIRKMGGQVFWCPTDSINAYNGIHQREIALVTKGVPLPSVNEINCPPARDGGGCTCGPERCRGNFGWDGMHPDLDIHRDDLMPNDPEVLYALCQQRGITHLIYMGVHTQVCLLGKSVGVANLLRAGMRCVLARDLTDAHGVYLPDESFTPDDLTADVIRHFETHLIPSIDLRATLNGAGMWAPDWVVDPVRLAPWGTEARPHHFNEKIRVTLTFPTEPGCDIFYTLDGSEPGRQSRRYLEPIEVSSATSIRAAAFDRTGRRSLVSEGYYASREALPAMPDIHLAELSPILERGPGHSASGDHFRPEPFTQSAQWNRSNRGGPLLLGGQTYKNGVGVHATNQLLFAVKPDYERFVALAGIDEEMLGIHHGSNLARHSSVIFRVFVDGRLQASSPVMRIGEVPWRFDVRLPANSRRISLVATDAGDGTKGDFANWVNAGFVLKP